MKKNRRQQKLPAVWASPDMGLGNSVIRNCEVVVEIALAGGSVDVDYLAIQNGDSPLMANPANMPLAALAVDTSLAQQKVQRGGITVAHAGLVEEYAVRGVTDTGAV